MDPERGPEGSCTYVGPVSRPGDPYEEPIRIDVGGHPSRGFNVYNPSDDRYLLRLRFLARASTRRSHHADGLYAGSSSAGDWRLRQDAETRRSIPFSCSGTVGVCRTLIG